MLKEIKEIYLSLQKGVHVAVATIISTNGSTPRGAGTKMIIHENGSIFGTIGGGEIEGDVIRLGMELFITPGTTLVTYDLNRSAAEKSMDLICGGTMKVLVEYLSTDESTTLFFKQVVDRINSDSPFFLSTSLSIKGENKPVQRNILELAPSLPASSKKVTTHEKGDEFQILEAVHPSQTLYIIGAGHVALELAQCSQKIDLPVHVIDDRVEYANRERFPAVNGLHHCPGYSNVFSPFLITAQSYIVIVTRSHAYDKYVLTQALQTDAGYIGMIGSRKKRNIIYSQLRAEGFDSSELDTVHCPVGLPIGAETPAELAVSIVAELIQHRAGA